MAAYPEFTAISLCTGIGMLDHGLNAALAGAFRAVIMVEREAFCVANLVAQMEGGFIPSSHIWDDVKTVTCAALRRFVGERLGGKRLDFIVGGIPCQPWSSAGRRRGRDDERDLWPAVLRAIAVYQPRFVFIENVDGIAGKIDGARRILCDLEQAGYFAKAGLFSSKEIGGAHLRRRWFFLGIAKNNQQFINVADGERARRKGRIGEQENAGKKFETAKRNGCGLADGSKLRRQELRTQSRITEKSEGKRGMLESKGNITRLADAICEFIPGRRGTENLVGAAGRIEIQEYEWQRSRPAACDGSLDIYTRVPSRNDFGAWALVAEADPALLPTLSTLAIRRIAERNVNGAIAGNLDGRPAGEDLQAAVEREFLRLADEYSVRDHKLRAIGNSVDWKVAMYAFVTLWACMEHELRGENIHEHGQIALF